MAIKFIVEHDEEDKEEVLERLEAEKRGILSTKDRLQKFSQGKIKDMIKKKLGKKGVTEEEVEEACETLQRDFSAEVNQHNKKSVLLVKGHPFFDHNEEKEKIVMLFYETITSPFLSRLKSLKRSLSLAKSKKFKTWLRAKMTNTQDLLKEEEDKSVKDEIAEDNREKLEETLNKKDGVDAEVSYEFS